MDRGLRTEVLATPARAGAGPERAGGPVAGIHAVRDRDRHPRGPARILGLERKGHLGPGADADVTIYAPDDDRRRMFALPRYVIKAGEVVVDDGELRSAPERPDAPTSRRTSIPRSPASCGAAGS